MLEFKKPNMRPTSHSSRPIRMMDRFIPILLLVGAMAVVCTSAEPPQNLDHWSFRPIRVVSPPKVTHEQWPTGPIDRYVLAQLEAKGLAPAPRADKHTLIRRLSFDLIGLPPSPNRKYAKPPNI